MDAATKKAIGPRVEDGLYFSGFWKMNYRVRKIRVTDDILSGWEMVCDWADGTKTAHSTAWDEKRDRVL